MVMRMLIKLPADCLRVLEVNGVSGTGDPAAQWEIEGGSCCTMRRRWRSATSRRVTELNLFDSLALEALIVLLASKLAPAIQGGSTGKATEFLEEYHRIVAPMASRVDGNESRRSKENLMDAMLAGSRALARGRSGGQESRVNGQRSTRQEVKGQEVNQDQGQEVKMSTGQRVNGWSLSMLLSFIDDC